LQDKSAASVPDATITQASFKIVVETKLTDWFYDDQLMRHLQSFGDEKYKVLLTIASEPMAKDKKVEFENKLKAFNAKISKTKSPVVHINTTFEKLANAVHEVLDDRDYELQDVLDDYLSYCYEDNLIPFGDAWKFMKMQLAGTTFNFNVQENVYYNGSERSSRPHDYLGLYRDKSVRAIGKIVARIRAVKGKNDEIKYDVEFGELTEERKNIILKAIEDGKNYSYDLENSPIRYFFVEKFYETDFKKITPRAPWGARVFDLTELLRTTEIPSTQELADKLKSLTWE
jgi:hypothetical protein